MKIHNKIIIINNIAFLIIIACFSFLLYLQVRGIIVDSINNDLESKNQGIVNLIEGSSETSIKVHLRSIAEKNRELMEMFYKRYQNGLMSEKEAYNAVSEIFLDPEYGKIGDTGYLAGVTRGGILAIHPRSPGADASGYDFMQRAMAMKNGYLEYMWKNQDEEQERSKAGWLSYFEPWDIMVWASSYKSEFRELVQSEDFENAILEMDFGEKGYPYIIDTRGNLIIHPFQKGENIFDAQDSEGRYFIREMCEKKDGTISYPWKKENSTEILDKIVHYSYIEEYDWIVATTYDEKEIFSMLRVFQLFFVIFIVVALGITFIINYLTGRFIAKPVNIINSGIQEILTGSISLNKNVSVASKDEIGTLAGMFNDFSARVRKVIIDLRQVSEESKRIGQDLAANSEEVSVTIEEISGTIVSFKEKTALLDKEVQNTGNVITATKDSISAISEKIEEQSATVTQSSAGIKAMIDTIGNLSSMARDKNTQLKSLTKTVEESENDISMTVNAIQEIADSTAAIFDMIKIINQVAAQTNLLAMNAAIEAAHAGDAGRGFAVVADEIRNLAETTSTNTKQISNSIKEILSRIDNTRDISENAGKTFNLMQSEILSITDSLKQLLDGMNEMAAGSEQINIGVDQMNSITQSVKDLSVDIGEKIETVQHTMTQLSNLSAQHLQGIEEIAAGTTQILSATNVLTDLGTSNSENISVIEKGIDQFEV